MYQRIESTLPRLQACTSLTSAHRPLRTRGKLLAASALVGITLGAGLVSGGVQRATHPALHTTHSGSVQPLDGGPWIVQSQDGGPWIVQSQDGGPWIV